MGNVEILMATYNGAKYLPAQLDSILAQDTDCWHLTVSDDESTDETPEILDDYVRRFPEKITRVYSGRRFGNARDHFFWLMKQCKADYMHFSDQDDVWHQEKVRIMQQALEQAEAQYGAQTPLLVFTDQAVVDEDLKPMAPSLMKMQQQSPEKTDYRNILFQNIVTGCTSAINRSLADLAGQCSDTTQVIMHDWWLALVAARFGKLVYLDTPTLDYRQHRGNSVGAKDVRSLDYIAGKFRHLSKLSCFFGRKKDQAKVFVESFRGCLTDGDRALVNAFSCKRSSLTFKIGFLRFISGFFRRAGFLLLW